MPDDSPGRWFARDTGWYATDLGTVSLRMYQVYWYCGAHCCFAGMRSGTRYQVYTRCTYVITAFESHDGPIITNVLIARKYRYLKSRKA